MKRILKYITRSWDDADIEYVHPRMKIFPPIVWDLFAFIVVLGVIYNLIVLLIK